VFISAFARILQPFGFTLGIVTVTVLMSLDNCITLPLLFRFTVSVKPTRTSLVAKFNPQGFMQILR